MLISAYFINKSLNADINAQKYNLMLFGITNALEWQQVSPLGTCGTNKELKWETVTKRRANTLWERNIQTDDSPDFFTGAELEEFSAPAVDEHNRERFTGRKWEQTAIANK